MSNVFLFSSIFKNEKDKKEHQDEKKIIIIQRHDKTHRMFVCFYCQLFSENRG